jgi:hypothetical protein
VLDVGAGFETVLLRDHFGEENVDVLGLFEAMPEDRSGDGHVREYTVRELLEAGEAAGLRPSEVTYANYAGGGRGRVALARVGPLMPRSLRLGLTLVFQREPEPST